MLEPAKKLAVGTVQFGIPYGIANRNRQVTVDEITAILNLAYKNNLDTLDTAQSYGESEEIIGNYLYNNPDKSFKIITKLGESEENINHQIQDSADKLNTNPTVVLAHSANLYMNTQFQQAITEARDNQMIKMAGVSLYCKDEINKVMDSNYKPQVIQIPLNILDTKLYQCGVVSKLADKGIEIHARSAFLQGLFYLSDSEINNRFSDVMPYLQKLKSIALESGLTLAELSLLWLVSLEEIIKVIIGVYNADQLKSHLETLNKKVDPSIFEEALSIHYENENVLNPSLWPSMY